MLGAADGLEAIFAIKALRHQIAPPTLSLENPAVTSKDIDLVGLVARPVQIDHVIYNGFGFGGVNASMIFIRFNRARSRWPRKSIFFSRIERDPSDCF